MNALVRLFGKEIAPEEIQVNEAHIFHEIRRISLQIFEEVNSQRKEDEKLARISRLSKSQTQLMDNFYLLRDLKNKNFKEISLSLSIKTLIGEILEEVTYLIPNCKDRVSLDLEELTTNKDPVLLKSLLFNLIENAFSHSKGVVKIVLKKDGTNILFLVNNKREEIKNHENKHFKLGLNLSSALATFLNTPLEIKEDEGEIVTQLVVNC